MACSYFEWLHVKHYCPYCDYMIGEYKGRNQIVFNEEALQRNNNEGHENNGRNQKVLNEVTFQRDNNMNHDE